MDTRLPEPWDGHVKGMGLRVCFEQEDQADICLLWPCIAGRWFLDKVTGDA